MELTWEDAIEEWQETADHLQKCAVTALRLALPGLNLAANPPYCCPVTLHIDKPGDLGAGRVCIDTDTRATVEIEDLDNTVIGNAADTAWGEGWFEGTDGPLADQEPGSYYYDDETTGAEWVIELGEDGTGKVLIECVAIPDAAALLAAITTARAQQQANPESAHSTGSTGR